MAGDDGPTEREGIKGRQKLTLFLHLLFTKSIVFQPLSTMD